MSATTSEDVLDALKNCLVPKCPRGNDFMLSKTDFDDYLSSIDTKLTIVDSLLTCADSVPRTFFDDIQISSLVLIVCGEHAFESLWTTADSEVITRNLFERFSSEFERAQGNSIFQSERILKSVLAVLRPLLSPSTFKCNPAAAVCYSWVLKQIKSPLIGDLLSDLLPSSLVITDDYEPHNITMGLECLRHIVENTAHERLKWYSQDEVILDAVKKCMYRSEPEIISSFLRCYISLMRKCLEHSTSLKVNCLENPNDPDGRNPFDDVINNVLFNMYVEQKLKTRRIYASNISDLIEARGLGVVRHLTLIFKTISEYTLEPSTTSDALKTLAKIIQTCWCRGASVGEGVLTIILKLTVEMAHNSGKYDGNVATETRAVIALLKQAFPQAVQDFVETFSDRRSSFDSEFILLIEHLFE